MALLVKLGEPMDRTLWGKLSVVAHVQVTVPLTATVSTAGLDEPLRPLLKKMSPTVTAAVVGVALPVEPPPVEPPAVPPPPGAGLIGLPLLGLVVIESLQPANTLAVNKPLTSSIM